MSEIQDAMDAGDIKSGSEFLDDYEGARFRQGLQKVWGIFDKPGSMYQVEIDASPDEFLDWDLPLSEQSEKVRRARMIWVYQVPKRY
jgi:hypothetical protein